MSNPTIAPRSSSATPPMAIHRFLTLKPPAPRPCRRFRGTESYEVNAAGRPSTVIHLAEFRVASSGRLDQHPRSVRTPMLVNDGTLSAAWSDTASSADGSGAVVWVQDTKPFDPNRSGGGPRIPNIWARVFDGASWSAPQRIGSARVARREDPTLGWQQETLLGSGTVSDAEANGAGTLILGAHATTYVSSSPFFLRAAYANVYVP
jgi:hypothetical protein